MPERHKLKVGFAGDSKTVEVEVPADRPVPFDLDSPPKVIGTSVPRLDGPVKSTGTARYTADLVLPRMLHAHTLRSPHAAAIVKRIDLEPARVVPGVVAILEVAPREIRYAGQELAVVAAETPEAARRGAQAIVIEYEISPAVSSADAGRADGAPAVFPGRSNRVDDAPVTRGDAAAAIQAAKHSIDATYRTQAQVHACLEPHGTVATWEDDGTLSIYTSTQATFGVRNQLARHFDLPATKVRVRCEHMGGGFGSKFAAGPFSVHAAELARQTKRPVRLMLDRAEEMVVGGSRPDSVQHVRLGADEAGRLVGIEVESYGTAGITGGAGVHNPKIYDFRGNLSKTHQDVYTNLPPACAFRAPGHPQGIFALESAIDELALAAGIDPLAMRRLNDLNPVRLRQYELGAAAIGWQDRRPFDPQATQPPGATSVRRGYGMASALWYDTGRKGHAVTVEIYPDGQVVVKNGAQDIGTGTRTVLAIAVAEELGIDPRTIEVVLGDTIHPPGPASGGSATAPSLVPTARDAGFLAARELARVVEAKAAARAKELSFAERAALIDGEMIAVTAERAENFDGYREECAGVQFAMVDVDVDTGIVQVRKVVAVQDAGLVVDRLTFESQVIGGVIQGLSYALFEERIVDPTSARMLNPDFLNYKIARSGDMPEIVVIPFDVTNGRNSTSTLGVGEPPMIPTAAAIANAVANACGARVRTLPLAPWNVLSALGKC